MSIRWITPLLGTASASLVRSEAGINIVDVRDMVDKAGNRPDAVPASSPRPSPTPRRP